MNMQRTLGLVLLVAGVILLVAGMNASDSLADRWSRFFTGHYTDATVWYVVGGGAAVVAGLMMATFGGRMRAT
jgi:hypothetical protein